MSFYNVEVVFTGLCFFCFGGDDPACQDFTYVYLVNAAQKQEVCKKTLPGDHKPILTFDRRHLEYADAHLYKLAPSPEGGQLVVAPLDRLVDGGKGIDICFREECLDPKGCTPPWPSRPGTADSLVGRAPRQDAPKWYKPDANHIDWLPYIPEVETACKDYDLRKEVAELKSDYVAGRIRIDWGTLSTHSHARRPRKGLLRPYAVWDSSHKDEEMPKAFAGAVTLTLPSLEGALLIQTECSGTPRTLFRLRGAPLRTLRLHVSNLPTHEMDSVGSVAQDHFRWYYRLYDWDYCPKDVAIPEVTKASREYPWLEGVMNLDVLCPPGGTKP